MRRFLVIEQVTSSRVERTDGELVVESGDFDPEVGNHVLRIGVIESDRMPEAVDLIYTDLAHAQVFDNLIADHCTEATAE